MSIEIVARWPTWFYRPDFPLGASLPASHVPTSSPLCSRSHSQPEAPKAPDFLDGSKIHGQTPTICTAAHGGREEGASESRYDVVIKIPPGTLSPALKLSAD
ncbi:hypothetical protein K0M31_003642 [Melipona bicolor]|uniref:Uncharacterized protein n=1 Tax=Melipona bicolor TaxID=60889 RepID=A0AA40KPQ9_9HYME|nr:hypothetical protein K0M31_003642 [Melipona bicolor]